jgi:16S rRNA (guanine527-N7)-methyltransferase
MMGTMRSSEDAFTTGLTTALARWSLPITPSQLDQLRAHFEAVVEANRTMNLTRITNPAVSAVKHYADSLALIKWVAERGITVRTILDVGTGAGFPAVPLAVMRPDWSITAIDATGKKIDFVRRAAAAVGLTNLQCEHAHSRHWEPGRTYELVTFRALQRLPASLEHTARHVARRRWLVAYKTARTPRDEQEAAESLSVKLKLRPHDRYAYTLEQDDTTLRRVLHIYRRVS